MSYLEQLKRLRFPDEDPEFLALMERTTFIDAEAALREGLRSCRECHDLSRQEPVDLEGIELAAKLAASQFDLAEVRWKIAARERGARLARISGRNAFLEAQRYAENHLHTLAPWLHDEGLDDDS